MIQRNLTFLLVALTASSVLNAPTIAEARTVTATVEMTPYRGRRAYVAVYLTKPNGQYHSTLSVRGRKSKYRRHLRGWYRGIARAGGQIDGVTGASVGASQKFTVKADIADNLLEAGYKIRVDTSVEDIADYKGEAEVTLNSTEKHVQGRGRRFVKSITVKM